ncbi:MAG: nucleotidyltransferase [Gemmatimonadaceae bacterium]
MKGPKPVESNDRLVPDFLDFVICLNVRKVEFVLVGGYAVGVHGFVRATGDIDFFYRRTEANVRRLCVAMEDFGAPSNVIDFETLMTPATISMFGRPPYRIDLLGDIDGVSFDQVWTGCTEIVLDGEQLRVIGLAELRANKMATGRKKDREDLRKLPNVRRQVASKKSKKNVPKKR